MSGIRAFILFLEADCPISVISRFQNFVNGGINAAEKTDFKQGMH